MSPILHRSKWSGNMNGHIILVWLHRRLIGRCITTSRHARMKHNMAFLLVHVYTYMLNFLKMKADAHFSHASQISKNNLETGVLPHSRWQSALNVSCVAMCRLHIFGMVQLYTSYVDSTACQPPRFRYLWYYVQLCGKKNTYMLQGENATGKPKLSFCYTLISIESGY